MTPILFFLLPGFIASVGYHSVTRSRSEVGYKLLLALLISNMIIYAVALIVYDEFGYIIYDYVKSLDDSNLLHEVKLLEPSIELGYLYKLFPSAFVYACIYSTFSFNHEKLFLKLDHKRSLRNLVLTPWNIGLHLFRFLHLFNLDPLTQFFIKNTGKKVSIRTLEKNEYIALVEDWGINNEEIYIKIEVFDPNSEQTSKKIVAASQILDFDSKTSIAQS